MNAAEPPVAHAEDNVTRTSSIHDLRHQSIKVVRCPSVTAQSLQSLFGRPGNTRAGITKDRIGISQCAGQPLSLIHISCGLKRR